MLHASHEWSRRNLQTHPDDVLAILLRQFAECIGLPRAGQPSSQTVHRWAYAAPAEPLPEPCLMDADRNLVFAGDWCGDNRVEGAYVSGVAAADWLAGQLA